MSDMVKLDVNVLIQELEKSIDVCTFSLKKTSYLDEEFKIIVRTLQLVLQAVKKARK